MHRLKGFTGFKNLLDFYRVSWEAPSAECDENKAKVQTKPPVTEGKFMLSHKFLNSRIKSP